MSILTKSADTQQKTKSFDRVFTKINKISCGIIWMSRKESLSLLPIYDFDFPGPAFVRKTVHRRA
jgi:hypothetical protein